MTTKKSEPVAKTVNRSVALPPVDFSFCELTDPKDIFKVAARSGRVYRPPPAAAPAQTTDSRKNEEEDEEDDWKLTITAKTKEGSSAYEFAKKKNHARGASKGGILEWDTASSDDGTEGRTNEQYLATQCKLCNNAIADVKMLVSILQTVIVNATQLTSLDLSFNCVREIPDDIASLPHLGALYLHANQVADVNEVKKLAPLKSLYALTLHGNPVEHTTRNYKYHVLWLLPKLKSLDFSAFTKRDRETVSTYVQFFRPDEEKKPRR